MRAVKSSDDIFTVESSEQIQLIIAQVQNFLLRNSTFLHMQYLQHRLSTLKTKQKKVSIIRKNNSKNNNPHTGLPLQNFFNSTQLQVTEALLHIINIQNQ